MTTNYRVFFGRYFPRRGVFFGRQTFARLALCRLCGRRIGAFGTGSVYGFLFSVQNQVEGLRQMQGRVVKGQLVYGGPEIEHVPLGATIRMKAVKNGLV